MLPMIVLFAILNSIIEIKMKKNVKIFQFTTNNKRHRQSKEMAIDKNDGHFHSIKTLFLTNCLCGQMAIRNF